MTSSELPFVFSKLEFNKSDVNPWVNGIMNAFFMRYKEVCLGDDVTMEQNLIPIDTPCCVFPTNIWDILPALY